MEILNILYSNNLIAVYLIGAILVVILIFIVISSIDSTPKEKDNILKDPTEDEINPNIVEIPNIEDKKEVTLPETKKINDIVEDLYQKSLDLEQQEKLDNKDLNSFLEEFEVPESVIEEVTNTDENYEFNDEALIKEQIKEEHVGEPIVEEIETPRLKDEQPKENIEDMLKRLYDLRQSENEVRKSALLNEIYDLKKQVDETLKSNMADYTIDYNYVDTKALADYYLFNEDIEFPKLK